MNSNGAAKRSWDEVGRRMLGVGVVVGEVRWEGVVLVMRGVGLVDLLSKWWCVVFKMVTGLLIGADVGATLLSWDVCATIFLPYWDEVTGIEWRRGEMGDGVVGVEVLFAVVVEVVVVVVVCDCDDCGEPTPPPSPLPSPPDSSNR